MQLSLALIPHEVDNALIYQRASDGYVNATAMCQASGKRFNHYSVLNSTGEFLREMSAVTGIPATDLVISIQGGIPELQGTWVHPEVAINLAQWCSPRFAVAVARWVMEWIGGKYRVPGFPYHVARYIANRAEIPPTHFSMLNEMLFGLIAPLEMAGYTLPERMVPDISEGLMFCAWLRKEKGIDTNALPTYRHTYEDGRWCDAKLYPNEVLADFKKHFHEVWLPKRAKAYFAKNDASALPFLEKALKAIDDAEKAIQ